VCLRVCDCRRVSESVRVRVHAGLFSGSVCGSVYADVWSPREFVCVFVRAFVCVRSCVCARARTQRRAHVPVHACVRVRVRFFGRSIGQHLRACCACACVCVCVRVRASWLCGRCGGTAGTGGVNSSAGGGRACILGSVRSALGVARVGRRGDVDEPYDQRAVGCARWADVRDWRRRRHLRHRRQQHLPLHLLQGRVGQHRRRYAAGLGVGDGRRVHQGGSRLAIERHVACTRRVPPVPRSVLAAYWRRTGGVLCGVLAGC
jgi:hypothetical protein